MNSNPITKAYTRSRFTALQDTFRQELAGHRIGFQVTEFTRKPQRQGSARRRYNTYSMKINIHSSTTKSDVEETIIHEFAHIIAWIKNVDDGHGNSFQRVLRQLFQIAHPEITPHLEPYRNRYHGRYTRALQAAGFEDGTVAAPRQPSFTLATRRLTTAIAASVVTTPPAPKKARGTAADRRDADVIRVLSETPESKPKEIAIHLGITEGQARHSLWRLGNEGRVENHRRGYFRVVGR